eukprot:TRINITY_DN452_c0_g1_i3.p1 TRINITY_DN452_c0_g1~~TRINITY_DN452_c0_g1_i3.p1  ORF type:complete len:347 (-),score=107.85 TRINITY_DN452_c0_g1_i3:42-1082(-)
MIAIFLTLLIFSGHSLSSPSKPKAAIIFIGAGARTPLKQIKEIENGKIEWLEGYGQATAAGLRQMYLLGRYIWQTYAAKNTLLSKTFDPSQILVRSVDERRNLVAAQSFALGLYPTGAAELTEDESKHSYLWEPPFALSIPDYVIPDLKTSAAPFDVPLVPVIAYNKSSEKLLEFAGCPKYKQAWDKYFQSETIKKFTKEHEKVLIELCKKYKVPFEDLKKGDNLHFFLDYIQAAGFQGKITEKPMDELLYAMYKGFFPEVRQLVLCKFSEVAQEHFEMAKKGKRKVLVLATDEMNVLGYLFAGKFKEKEKKLKFGSSVEMKLYEDGANYKAVSYTHLTLPTTPYV